jgi:putative NADH-flavin reductase
MNKIAVFGASGETGKSFTELALKNGYAVKALVRTPSKLDIKHPNLQVIQGDVFDQAKVEETINGTEAVIDFLGPATNSPADLRSTSIRNILEAMRKSNVRRLISQASLPFGVVDAKDQLNLGLQLKMFLAKNLMGKMVQDARQHADLIKHTDLDWTIVRAPGLDGHPAQGKYRVGFAGSDLGNSISRPNIATFILDELKSARYIRQMPLVSN